MISLIKIEHTETNELQRAAHDDVVLVFTNIYFTVSCFPLYHARDYL